jgi:hypothetical protein
VPPELGSWASYSDCECLTVGSGEAGDATNRDETVATFQRRIGSRELVGVAILKTSRRVVCAVVRARARREALLRHHK